jgi:hypothetical protein
VRLFNPTAYQFVCVHRWWMGKLISVGLPVIVNTFTFNRLVILGDAVTVGLGVLVETIVTGSHLDQF